MDPTVAGATLFARNLVLAALAVGLDGLATFTLSGHLG